MEEFNIFNLLIILIGAWVGGAAAKRMGYPAILGELVIGIILGPAVLGMLETSEMISVLAEVGIILLMVYIGMEINFRDLGRLPGRVCWLLLVVLLCLLAWDTTLSFTLAEPRWRLSLSLLRWELPPWPPKAGSL